MSNTASSSDDVIARRFMVGVGVALSIRMSVSYEDPIASGIRKHDMSLGIDCCARCSCALGSISPPRSKYLKR